jgi:hypothetical protein
VPPDAQSAATVQDVLHARAVASHRYGEQLVFAAVQSPPALHVAASDKVTASEQIASAHPLPVFGTRHARAPSQVASPLQGAVPICPHSASGSVPVATGPQVPLAPVPFLAAEHASQVPEQGVSQHTPSAQLPLVQSASSAHALGVHGLAG